MRSGMRGALSTPLVYNLARRSVIHPSVTPLL
jgi:hypothetical protein